MFVPIVTRVKAIGNGICCETVPCRRKELLKDTRNGLKPFPNQSTEFSKSDFRSSPAGRQMLFFYSQIICDAERAGDSLCGDSGQVFVHLASHNSSQRDPTVLDDDMNGRYCL